MPALVTPSPEEVFYGVPITSVGEDGDMLAFGHVDPRRALAAFNRYARTVCGLLNLADDRSATTDDMLNSIRHEWAVFHAPDPDDGDDPDWVWVMDTVAAGTEHAVPITHYMN